ncbi:DUF2188 domain-containing protein [Lactiplantibacillus plantarum]|uniref:hypothetical protein n=1 Tax=Lactiplantibacillus plantarum TaxID=1590 RepID=UPI001E2E5443|nr:hypothetical protein [Lactiplantibacillus plantarum]MCC6114881.1 hypothetical protein [Lactiplantibacillus plantarum]MCW6131500.1 hypothetical protein [Lactiplantibacillus plantarum]
MPWNEQNYPPSMKNLKKVVRKKAIEIAGLKSIFETDFKRHSEPRLPSTAQINH